MSETKITVIYDNPVDPEAFEAAFESQQLEAARRIPGHIRFEASKVWPKEDGSPTPAHRMIDLYYPDYAAASAAAITLEAGAFLKRWDSCPPEVCECSSPTSRYPNVSDAQRLETPTEQAPVRQRRRPWRLLRFGRFRAEGF